MTKEQFILIFNIEPELMLGKTWGKQIEEFLEGVI